MGLTTPFARDLAVLDEVARVGSISTHLSQGEARA